MKYIFHHVGVLTNNIDRNLKVLRDLLGYTKIAELSDGNGVVKLLRQEGSDVSIALFDRPFNETYGKIATKADIMHVAFETDDYDEAIFELKKNEADILWENEYIMRRRTIGVKTPEGRIVIVLEKKEDFFETAEVTPLLTTKEATFNHIGLLSKRFRDTEAYWSKMFHLHKTYEMSIHDSGYYVMVDEGFEEGKHDFTIEVFSGPHMYPVDRYAITEKGESYYHFGFLSPDADKMQQVYNTAVESGLFPAMEPFVDADFACTFLHGPDRIIYEFLTASLGAIEKIEEWDIEAENHINPVIPYPTGLTCEMGVKGGKPEKTEFAMFVYSPGFIPEIHQGDFGNDLFHFTIVCMEDRDHCGEWAEYMMNHRKIQYLDLCADFDDAHRDGIERRLNGKVTVRNCHRYPEQTAKLDQINWNNYVQIVIGEGLNYKRDRIEINVPACHLTMLGVSSVDEACEAALEMANEGVEFFGLCRMFGGEGTDKVIKTLDDAGKLYSLESAAI